MANPRARDRGGGSAAVVVVVVVVPVLGGVGFAEQECEVPNVWRGHWAPCPCVVPFGEGHGGVSALRRWGRWSPRSPTRRVDGGHRTFSVELDDGGEVFRGREDSCASILKVTEHG